MILKNERFSLEGETGPNVTLGSLMMGFLLALAVVLLLLAPPLALLAIPPHPV